MALMVLPANELQAGDRIPGANKGATSRHFEITHVEANGPEDITIWFFERELDNGELNEYPEKDMEVPNTMIFAINRGVDVPTEA